MDEDVRKMLGYEKDKIELQEGFPTPSFDLVGNVLNELNNLLSETCENNLGIYPNVKCYKCKEDCKRDEESGIHTCKHCNITFMYDHIFQEYIKYK